MNGYFDHNATAPMLDEAREVWLRTETAHWHNPSGLYREAASAKRLLEDLREELAEAVGAEDPERVVFTSGASEANNAVMRLVAEQSSRPATVLLSPLEHPSVREPARKAFEQWGEAALTPAGAVEVEVVQEALAGETVSLVSVMAANNETGVLQPWLAIADACRERGVWFHCDAAQWIGRLPIDGLSSCGYVTACAHKFGGPRGVGFLLLPKVADGGGGRAWTISAGGPQEHGHRAGTENLPAIAAMMAALRLRRSAPTPTGAGRDDFERAVSEAIEGCRVIGGGADRLWNTSLVELPSFSNLKWLTRLSRRGICVSTGSACSAGKGNPSHVMAAMGLDHEAMGRVLRFSGGWETGAADWASLAEALVEVWRELREGGRSIADSRSAARGDLLR